MRFAEPPAATLERGIDHTIVVGVGELAIVTDPRITLSTHALGSCIAVSVWDPIAHVAGLLHFLLPDSTAHEDRARVQPEAFADTGIPLLLDGAFLQGLERDRAIVRLIGATVESSLACFRIAERNLIAARRVLADEGIRPRGELTGGSTPRSVYMSAETGRLVVKTGAATTVLG